MMSRIDRISRAFAARRAGRLRVDGAKPVETAQLPVLIEPPVATARPQRAERRQGDVEFSAQLIGQDGQRRGLRGGSPVLEQARSTYNRIEWSGARDRRARKGRQAKTEA
jgi:hypothetical protein